MVVPYSRSPGEKGALVMTTPTPLDGGGPAAGRSGKITRGAVLAAALEIIDRDGADALSMRRLARALDRDPMILYRHAPNKAALLDGVAETVLAQLHVDSADPDWAGQLRAVARRYRTLALAHPHAVPLIVTRPLATPPGLRPAGTLRPLEDILALLTRAGSCPPGQPTPGRDARRTAARSSRRQPRLSACSPPPRGPGASSRAQYPRCQTPG
jgi:AcrR family transcriptional regulator